jgi:radical SAM superfamily enzyme YgiQ (UPF0313 family)
LIVSGCAVKDSVPHILCVNPWIHDFAAYDFWARPTGLLTLAAILRKHGMEVSWVDCLDRFHPRFHVPESTRSDGRGPYHKEAITKPAGLKDVTRTFSRYGIPPAWLEDDLQRLRPPDLILVTSMMTYWAPGVRETIAVIKKVFPVVPVLLGGIYATLCPEHAQEYSGADQVVTGAGDSVILEWVAHYCGFSVAPKMNVQDLNSYPFPAFDLQRRMDYIPLQTSRGCPFSCPYCASNYLNPQRMVRHPRQIVQEIEYWHQRYGIRHFVFYDDALLIDPETHAIPLLEQIIKAKLDVSFHTPNALHMREITFRIASLMFTAGFKTIRLGLETAIFDKRDTFDGKVSEKAYYQCVSALNRAGFKADQVGAYLLFGLPDQSLKAVETSIRIVKNSGMTPILAYYSPIPHTSLWSRAVSSSRYDLAADPIYTNNAIFPCQQDAFSWKTVTHLKEVIAGI